MSTLRHYVVVVFVYGGGGVIYISAYASDRMENFEWHWTYRGWCAYHALTTAWITLFVILVVRSVVSMHVCAWYWAGAVIYSHVYMFK